MCSVPDPPEAVPAADTTVALVVKLAAGLATVIASGAGTGGTAAEENVDRSRGGRVLSRRKPDVGALHPLVQGADDLRLHGVGRQRGRQLSENVTQIQRAAGDLRPTGPYFYVLRDRPRFGDRSAAGDQTLSINQLGGGREDVGHLLPPPNPEGLFPRPLPQNHAGRQ